MSDRPAVRIILEQCDAASLVSRDQILVETAISLLQPVAVGVGCDGLPTIGIGNALDRTKLQNARKLFLTREVVWNIVEKDLAAIRALGSSPT